MSKNEIKPLLLVGGVVIAGLGSLALLPLLAALIDGAVDDAWAFAISSGLFLFIGVGLILANQPPPRFLNLRQTFVLVSSIWLLLALFAAFPLMISSAQLDFTDACFEAMSGLTTTGATIMVDLDNTGVAVLLWRGLLQWIGGIGIVVTAIAILPMLRIGGMQLFRLEFSDTRDQLMPRVAEFATYLSGLYFFLSFFCFLAYWIAGMTLFDALIHAMTTIATGGFSNHDASFGYFERPAILIVAIVFMLASSLPFLMYVQMLRGRFGEFYQDPQAWWFLTLVLLAVLGITLATWQLPHPDGLPSMLAVAFNVVSVITGTGYASHAYDQWSSGLTVAFFCLMFIGGCAGSTCCGIKVFRIELLLRAIGVTLQQAVYPNRVQLIRYGRYAVDDRIILSIASYVFLFFLSFAVLASLLSLRGLTGITALSAAASALANVGPGLGELVGPAATYAQLDTITKWLLLLAMLLGRLEFFTIIAILTPAFWRR